MYTAHSTHVLYYTVIHTTLVKDTTAGSCFQIAPGLGLDLTLRDEDAAIFAASL
jgi:hypothetical protein